MAEEEQTNETSPEYERLKKINHSIYADFLVEGEFKKSEEKEKELLKSLAALEEQGLMDLSNFSEEIKKEMDNYKVDLKNTRTSKETGKEIAETPLIEEKIESSDDKKKKPDEKREKKAEKGVREVKEETGHIKSIEEYAEKIRTHIHVMEHGLTSIFKIMNVSIQQEFDWRIWLYQKATTEEIWKNTIFKPKSNKAFLGNLHNIGIHQNKHTDFLEAIHSKLDKQGTGFLWKEAEDKPKQFLRDWIWMEIKDEKKGQVIEHINNVILMIDKLEKEMVEIEKMIYDERRQIPHIPKDLPAPNVANHVRDFWARYERMIDIVSAKSVINLLNEETPITARERKIIYDFKVKTVGLLNQMHNIHTLVSSSRKILSSKYLEKVADKSTLEGYRYVEKDNPDGLGNLLNALKEKITKAWLGEKEEKSYLVILKPRIERDFQMLENNFIHILIQLKEIAETLDSTMKELGTELLFLTTKENKMLLDWERQMKKRVADKDMLIQYTKMLKLFRQLHHAYVESFAKLHAAEEDKMDYIHISVQKEIAEIVRNIYVLTKKSKEKGYFEKEYNPEQTVEYLLPLFDFSRGVPEWEDVESISQDTREKNVEVIHEYLETLIHRMRAQKILIEDIQAINQ